MSNEKFKRAIDNWRKRRAVKHLIRLRRKNIRKLHWEMRTAQPTHYVHLYEASLLEIRQIERLLQIKPSQRLADLFKR